MSIYTILPARIYEGALLLINAAHPLTYEPEADQLTPLPAFGPQVRLEATAAKMFSQLLFSCNGQGRIVVTSAYRPYAEQQQLYTACLRQNGTRYTAAYVALPGCSEHQSGLCADVAKAGADIDPICPAFPDEGVCRAFRSKAGLYGFIERYPQDKTQLTGIGYEPWHFRYVGYPHAMIMNQLHLCLEEYIPYLKRYCSSAPLCYRHQNSRVEIFFVPMNPGTPVSLSLPDDCPVQLSGNNEDGLVVSVWTGR